MSVLFFIPLACIAVFEAGSNSPEGGWVQNLWIHPDQGGAVGEEQPDVKDPEVDAADQGKGWKISKVPFDELVKMFPDTTHVSLHP